MHDLYNVDTIVLVVYCYLVTLILIFIYFLVWGWLPYFPFPLCFIHLCAFRAFFFFFFSVCWYFLKLPFTSQGHRLLIANSVLQRSLVNTVRKKNQGQSNKREYIPQPSKNIYILKKYTQKILAVFLTINHCNNQ